MIPKFAKCWGCWYWDQDHEICLGTGTQHDLEHCGGMEPACEGFRDRNRRKLQSMPAAEEKIKPLNVPAEEEKTAMICIEMNLKSAQRISEDVDQLGQYILQLGQIMGAMQKRLDDLEAKQAAVTISHADVKQLQARIRTRADEFCRKYQLTDPESIRQVRAAIRKAALKHNQVKDLHDVPTGMLRGTETMIDSWTDIRLVMERRKGVRA